MERSSFNNMRQKVGARQVTNRLSIASKVLRKLSVLTLLCSLMALSTSTPVLGATTSAISQDYATSTSGITAGTIG